MDDTGGKQLRPSSGPVRSRWRLGGKSMNLMSLQSPPAVRLRRTTTALHAVAIDLEHFENFNDTPGHSTGELKLSGLINRSFVRELVTCTSDQAIALTIIAMANSLGLDVIAEGGETAEQRALLEQLGCKHYQGYLYSRSIDGGAFQALLAAPPVAWSGHQPAQSTNCHEECGYA